MGSEKWGESQSVDAIIPIFRQMGAAAGAAKCLMELRTPIKKATRLIRRIYGKVIRASKTVSSYLIPELPKPYANTEVHESWPAGGQHKRNAADA